MVKGLLFFGKNLSLQVRALDRASFSLRSGGRRQINLQTISLSRSHSLAMLFGVSFQNQVTLLLLSPHTEAPDEEK